MLFTLAGMSMALRLLQLINMLASMLLIVVGIVNAASFVHPSNMRLLFVTSLILRFPELETAVSDDIPENHL
jgi:hypothetical protein